MVVPWRVVSPCLGALLALGLIAACGDDDDGGGSNEDLIDALVSEGATEEDARCVVDELGDDAERLLTADDADLTQDDFVQMLEALEACDVE